MLDILKTNNTSPLPIETSIKYIRASFNRALQSPATQENYRSRWVFSVTKM